MEFGVQLFSIPSLIDKDLKGTLEWISTLGYRTVEFFGPYTFSHELTKKEWEGFKLQLGLNQHAFYGFSVLETKLMLDDFGLSAPAAHVDLLTFRECMDEMLDSLALLGVQYVVLPLLFSERESLDDYKRRAEEFNKFGEKTASYNITFAYHNHGYEHNEIDGIIPMQFLLEQTHSDLVKFELDIFWMSAAGGNPIDFLKAYPNRFKLIHLKDATEVFRFEGDGGTQDQWMAAFPFMADPGFGAFDMKTILKVANTAGVDHFLVERDLTPHPTGTLENSIKKLKSLMDEGVE